MGQRRSRNCDLPPFYRLVRFTVGHKDPDLVDAGASDFAQRLREAFGTRVLGPEFPPPVKRVRNYFLKLILLKVEKEAPLAKVKAAIRQTLIDFETQSSYKQARVVVDVDPY